MPAWPEIREIRGRFSPAGRAVRPKSTYLLVGVAGLMLTLCVALVSWPR